MSGILAVLLAGLAVQDDEIAREALRGFRMPWSGFGPGSSVTYVETLLRPEISDAGTLEYKEERLRQVCTLEGGPGEKSRLRLAGRGLETTLPMTDDLPQWTRGRGTRKGTASLEAAGKTWECAVTELLFDGKGNSRQVTTIHRSKGAPHWALRWRVENLVDGELQAAEEELLLSASEKVKVGDREVSCRVIQVTVTTAGGARTVHKDWRSDEVPGRLVRRETRFFQGDKEVRAAFSKKEVVSFKVRQ